MNENKHLIFSYREGSVQLRVCFSPFIQPDIRDQQAGLSETREQVSWTSAPSLRCCQTSVAPYFIVFNINCVLCSQQCGNPIISVCRAFYLALYKHMMFLEKRGCPRTALEFCKLILRYEKSRRQKLILKRKMKNTK